MNLPGSGTGLESTIVFGPEGTDDKLEVLKDKESYEPGTKLNEKQEVELHKLSSKAQKNMYYIYV